MTDKDLDNTLKECIESMVEYIRTVTKQTLIEAFQKKERANNPQTESRIIQMDKGRIFPYNSGNDTNCGNALAVSDTYYQYHKYRFRTTGSCRNQRIDYL